MSCHCEPPTELRLFAGQIEELPVVLLDDPETPTDLTGLSLVLSVQPQFDSDEVLFTWTQSNHATPEEGKTTIPVDLSTVDPDVFRRGAEWVGTLYLSGSGKLRPRGNVVLKVSASTMPRVTPP